jgi:nucleoside-diphosphate-sugar epimerase
MKALVTGGGGFLGSAIVRLLLEKGWSVRVTGRNDYPELQKQGVECIRADVADAVAMERAVSDMDVVFHVAALAGIWGRHQDFYNTNVIGTKNIIDACLKKGVKRLVYTSSPSVVFDGNNMENGDETAPYPRHYHSSYPETKATAEIMVLSHNGRSGLMSCALRPHLIWGPGDNHLIPRFLQRARSNALRIVGDGKNLVDTVYVDNAAQAHLLAAERLVEGSAVCGSAYFISNGEPIPLFEWINRFVSASGQRAVTKKIPASVAYFAGACFEFIYRLFRIRKEPRMTRFLAKELSTAHWFNLEKARRDLGYNPEISNEEGFRRTFESEYFKKLCQDI